MSEEIAIVGAYCTDLLPLALGALLFAVACVAIYAKYKFRQK